MHKKLRKLLKTYKKTNAQTSFTIKSSREPSQLSTLFSSARVNLWITNYGKTKLKAQSADITGHGQSYSLRPFGRLHTFHGIRNNQHNTKRKGLEEFLDVEHHLGLWHTTLNNTKILFHTILVLRKNTLVTINEFR